MRAPTPCRVRYIAAPLDNAPPLNSLFSVAHSPTSSGGMLSAAAACAAQTAMMLTRRTRVFILSVRRTPVSAAAAGRRLDTEVTWPLVDPRRCEPAPAGEPYCHGNT